MSTRLRIAWLAVAIVAAGVIPLRIAEIVQTHNPPASFACTP